ncbi:siderophore-interacting protein [Bifidobacterium sp. ESL0763]|uniref:siderophore-interacting protein n=1 Tax=Bifidobacterium sp. ESL0763 TaxID=2983227 RepID=UPI0023F86DAE|nr:siderophore-interacting protein [Bifidobacterium sp. ESL0763]MDF7664495.1 siderophore-interacting protein [Bifidobacterium sp. ESL0763]
MPAQTSPDVDAANDINIADETAEQSAADLPMEPPAFQPYLVSVARKRRLSPHFMRIVFAGSELGHFGTDGYDQRIKVMLPMTLTHPETWHSRQPWADPLLFDPASIAHGGWWDQWRALPPGRRNVFRTYTVRAVDQASREVTVDFVLHDDAGPAGTFAATCRPGDAAVLIGPNAHSTDSALGIDFHPDRMEPDGESGLLRDQSRTAPTLLVGDETATPAIAAILEGLARDSWTGRVDAFIEVPRTGDFLRLSGPQGSAIHWVARDDAPRGARLLTALSAWCSHTAIDNPHDSAAAGDPAGINDTDTVTVITGTDTAHPETSEQPARTIDPIKRISNQNKRIFSRPAPPFNPATTYCWLAGEATLVRSARRLLVNEFAVAKAHISFMGYWREGKAEL